MWDLQLSSPAVTAFMASGAEVSLEVAASHSEPAALPALPEGETMPDHDLMCSVYCK